jgi:hypothetical protein
MTLFCSRRVYILLILFFSSYLLFSQNEFKGKIIDEKTHEPVVFANIIFNESKTTGTVTDINGFFTIKSTIIINKITISYVGYKTKIINFNKSISNVITLKRTLNKLDEVTINSKENPAIRIIKKVIENKALNNPNNIKSFTFRMYNKVVMDFVGSIRKDSLEVLKNKFLFITETVSDRKYLFPNFTEDIIVGTKVSGFKNPSFASLSTDVQPFSFYDDNIKLLDLNYLNPISKGSLKSYKFKLEEEYYNKKDTIFVISFKPKKNKNIEGLKGLLYINSNKYAIQNIDATPFQKLKTTIKIQQQYIFIDNKYWFPEQLNYELIIGNGKFSIRSSGKSYITDVNFNKALTKKDFSLLSVRFDKDAQKKGTLFWDNSRNDKLSVKEIDSYKFLDSLGRKYHFDAKLKVAESLVDGRLKFNYFDINLNKTLIINKYENVRIGTGIYSNDKLFKNIEIGGFLGFGIRDEKWKYGGEIIVKLSKTKAIDIALKYQNSLKEVGLNEFNKDYQFFSPRNYIGFRMNQIEEYSIRSNIKTHKNIEWILQLNNTKIIPKYDYQFNEHGQLLEEFTNTEFNVNLKYSVKENIVESFHKKISLATEYPILNLTYSRGFKNILDGFFNYNKVEFSIDQTFTTKKIGVTTYRLKTGFIDADLPYGLLFTGEGAFDKDWSFYFKNNFQTVTPYEFLSSSYVNVFTSHNFGGLLFKKNNFQPDIVIHNNIGYGSLKNANQHENIDFKVKNKVFLETGLEFRSIIKLNVLDMFSLGFGAQVFYRYGYYRFPNENDNLKFKFVMNLSMK